MKCNRCGREVPDNYRFCDICGNRLDETKTVIGHMQMPNGASSEGIYQGAVQYSQQQQFSFQSGASGVMNGAAEFGSMNSQPARKAKEINIPAVVLSTVLVAGALIGGAALLLGGKEENNEPSAKDTQLQEQTAERETIPETVPQTEPEPVYELQTKYLLVRTTLENWDGSGTHTTEYEYDEYGNQILSRNLSSGSYTEYVFDECGNVTASQSYQKDGSVGGRYEYTYDEQGNMLTNIYYGSDGEVFSEYRYSYDENGRKNGETYVAHYSGETTNYEFIYSDDYTQCVINTYVDDVLHGCTVEQYDTQGRLVETNTYDANNSWQWKETCEYDDQGRISVVWNYSSLETQADYDVIYTYDENGLLIYRNVDYYYGYGMEYFYEPFEVLVRVN